MRTERKVKSIFWGLLYSLPLVLLILSTFRTGNTENSLAIVQSFSFEFIDNIILSLSNSIDMLEFNPYLVACVSYFVSVEIIQIFYEFMVFIPKLARKWLEGFYD